VAQKARENEGDANPGVTGASGLLIATALF
jgi:hypothetical protein